MAPLLFFFVAKMKKILLALALVFALGSVNQSFAQSEKFEIGGNFDFNILNSIGAVEFSPKVGYHVFKNLTVSVGLIGIYSWDRRNSYSAWSYGVGLGARYVLFNIIYAEALYQFNPYVAKYGGIEELKERGVNHRAWVGAGYRQRITSNTCSYVGFLYDLLAPTDVIDNPRLSVTLTHSF